MKRIRALLLVSTVFLSSCSSTPQKPLTSPSPSSETLPSPSPSFEISNLKACQSWQKAVIEFLEIKNPELGAYWSFGIKVKNGAQIADIDLKSSLLIVAEKYNSTTEEDFKKGWNVTKEQDAARNKVIDLCAQLGVFVN